MGRRRNTLELSWCLAVLACLVSGGAAKGYYGTRIGRLEPLHHQVKGEVYAVDSRTIHIRGFSYDGTAPDAFFYAGSTQTPSNDGFIIPDENGGVQPLGLYRNKDVTLTLPEGKTLKDIKWISIWCRAYSIDFGHTMVSKNLDYPRPQKIDALPTFQHGLSSDRVVVVDAQTFLVPNFNYDGLGPDAYFWVGKGSRPDNNGIVVPDENGSEEPLKKYSGKTIVITLPGELTVFDVDYLGVWCRAFSANFGHILLPSSLNVPPSLKMLGVAPQHSGYSYQPPSVDRPAFTYKPQTHYKPSTFRPRYSSRSSEESDSRPSPYFSPSSSVFPSHQPSHFGSSGRSRHSHETDSSEEEERSYRKSSSSSSSSSSSHFGGRRSKEKGSSFPPRSSSSHHSRLPSNVHRRAERPHKHSSSSSSSSSGSSFSFSSGGSSSSFNIYGK